MNGAVTVGAVLIASALCLAEPPPGYELVEVMRGPIEAVSCPQLNECGEIVFSWGYFDGPNSEVFHYENGLLTQVTDNTDPDTAPDINDAGTMTWILGYDGFSAGEIVLLEPGGELTVIGPGAFPKINSSGHLAWDHWYGTGCDGNNGAIFFYDGEQVHQITSAAPSDQAAEINDLDEIAWTRVDFCAHPDLFSVMFYQDSTHPSRAFPSALSRPQLVTLNNSGQAAWFGDDGIELCEDFSTTLITDWGRNPKLNDQGDILFLRGHEDTQTWQAWFRHHTGTFYQLTDDPFYNMDGDINEYAEMVWRTLDPDAGVWGIRYLRRARTGDTDFDLEVDLEDYSPWAGCFTGPFETDRLCECRFMDMDEDRDVDLADFALFQNARPAGRSAP